MLKGSLEYNLPFVMDNIGGKDLQKGRSDGQGSQRTSNKAEDAATGLRWISFVSFGVDRMIP